MDALRCPPGDADVTKLSGGERRRVALCRLLLRQPDLLLLDEPTNHLDAESVGWLERHLAEYPGTVVAVTHDRYFLDNVAGWILELDRGRGMPFEGNYSAWLEQKRSAWPRRRSRRRAPAHDRRRARVGAPEPQGPPDQAEGAPGRTTRRCSPRSATSSSTRSRSTSRPGRGSATSWSRPTDLRKGFGDRLLIEDLSFKLPRGGIVGVIGAQRRRQDDAVPHDHRPGAARRAARCGSATPSSSPTSTSRATRSTPDKTVWEEISGGEDQIKVGDREMNSRAYTRRLQLQGLRPAEEGRQAVGRRAQPPAPGQAAAHAAATCCCSTSRPTTSTSTRCARWRRRC